MRGVRVNRRGPTFRWPLAVAALLALLQSPGHAHEVRPGYLGLTETSGGQFDVIWKVPLYRGTPLFIRPTLPDFVEPVTPIVTRTTPEAEVKQWTVAAPEGLRGKAIAVQNLESTLTDVLVRIEFADGKSETLRLTANAPSGIVPAAPSTFSVARNYFALGVEHILLGIDHLLFVLALLLLVQGVWLLVETVTAFTIAHSITLAVAALGFVDVRSQPVEAVIALSIVFVAAEVLHSRQGRPSLSARYPWAIAFAFGLLHGFGFAGALANVGLPQDAIPLALLFFNVGVEAGQLLFIGAVFVILAVLKRAITRIPTWSYSAAAYIIGITATYWLFQRLAALN